MEYAQPRVPQRQNYPPGGGYNSYTTQGTGSRTAFPTAPQVGVPNVAQSGVGLTRAERQEAKRLVEEAKFSFEGYQVVRREFISHRFDPAMTIRGNSITFNNSCISKLEDATYIQFLINPTEQKLAIRPCDEGARDAVRWCVIRGDKRKSRQITCKPFTTKLYELMGWESLYRYRLQGMRITYQNEYLYLFDLSANECFLPQTRDPETGKIRRTSPILPDEWMDSFGMSVDEHSASTRIDLTDGFTSPDHPQSAEDATEAEKMPGTESAQEVVV